MAVDPNVTRVEGLIDRMLSCGGDLVEAHAAARAILAASPDTADPDQVWPWLAGVADAAESSGAHALAAKIALVCLLWNRVLIPQDPAIQTGALARTSELLEARVYETGLTCLCHLAPTHRLGGDRRGEFLVEDAKARVADRLIFLHDNAVPISGEAYRLALSLADAA